MSSLLRVGWLALAITLVALPILGGIASADPCVPPYPGPC